MDSVIAKLDGSVFGMLIEQEPRILICGVTADDAGLIDTIRPDFVCPAESSLKQSIRGGVRVLDSPEDLPVISGADDPRALNIGMDLDPEEALEMIKKAKPDTVILELSRHDEKEHAEVSRLVKAVRSLRPEMTD